VIDGYCTLFRHLFHPFQFIPETQHSWNLSSKSEPCQLASLLKSFLGKTFQVSPVVDMKENMVDFTVTDSKGISCRERMCILYISPSRKDVKAHNAREFVEFLTFEDFPHNLKPCIDVRPKVPN